MNRVTFYEDHLEITSYGNGHAFAVVNHKTGNELFVQGDDAKQFRDEVLKAPNAAQAYDDHEWVLAEQPRAE